MAEQFRASFVLALKDDLSKGLQKIIAQTKHLRDLAQSLGFKPLEGADAIVNRLDRDVAHLNRGLGATARQAETAAGAIRRMSAAELGRAREQASQVRQSMELQRRISGGGTIGTLYGPGMPLMSGRERFVPNETGPMSRRGWRGRAGTMWANVRGGVAGAGEQIGLAGGAMAGISLAEPIRAAAAFDNVLTHIAITAGATAETVGTKVAEMATRYRAMAIATKQSSHDVAEAAQFLITTGIGEEMTNKLLPMIAQAATAYNTPIRDAVQGAFSMHEELGIKPEDMQGALSAAALAAKQGHFSFSDISAFLPSVAAQAATMGIKGRGGLDSLLAALETSRRGAGTSGQAATNLQDFLSYINAPIGTHSFAKAGIDLPALLQNAEKQGVNPLEAVVERVRQMTAGMTEAQSASAIGKVFHNQEARIFVETMLRELHYYQETKEKLAHASDQTIQEDFEKAQNLHTRLAELAESSEQLNQRVGVGFSWVVPIGTAINEKLLGGLKWMDTHLPGVANGMLGVTGGMLALVALIGTLGVVVGPVKAGFLLISGALRAAFGAASLAMLNPWTLAIGAIIAVVGELIAHWKQFGDDVRTIGTGIVQMVQGDIVAGITKAWAGLSDILLQPFRDLDTWLDGWVLHLGEKLSTLAKQAFPDSNGAPGDGRQAPVPVAPGTAAPTGREDVPGYIPGAYHPGGGGGAQVIHISFTADVPGRASITGDAMARGPMLSRA